MNFFRCFLFISLISASFNVFAFELFGPENYDECVVDGLKGLSNADGAIGSVRRMCRDKFPKLKKLRNRNTHKFSCLLDFDPEVVESQYKDSTIILGKLRFSVIKYTEEKMFLKLDDVDQNFTGFGEVYFGTGSFNFKIKNKKTLEELDGDLTCFE